MIEYDPTIQALLVENNCGGLNHNVLGIKCFFTCKNEMIIEAITWIEDKYPNENGCVFTFPNRINNSRTNVHFSSLSKEEIRKVIKLRAFI